MRSMYTLIRSFGVDTEQDMSCAHATVMEGVHAAPTLDKRLQKHLVSLKFQENTCTV